MDFKKFITDLGSDLQNAYRTNPSVPMMMRQTPAGSLPLGA